MRYQAVLGRMDVVQDVLDALQEKTVDALLDLKCEKTIDRVEGVDDAKARRQLGHWDQSTILSWCLCFHADRQQHGNTSQVRFFVPAIPKMGLACIC